MSAVAHIDEYKKGTFYHDDFRGEMSWNGYETNVLLRHEGFDDDGTPRFTDVAMATGADEDLDARGTALFDFDNDGDLDIAVNHNPGDSGIEERSRAVLLRNNVGEKRFWLAVEVQGTASNRDGIGAVVRIETPDGQQSRLVMAGEGYASQSSLRLYFGLGEHPRVERMSVFWPTTGETQTFEDIEARQRVRVVEGDATLQVLPMGLTGAPGP